MTDYYCNECKTTISPKVFNYSKEKSGRPLCFNCQRKPKPTVERLAPKRHRVRQRVAAKPQTPEERALLNALLDRKIRINPQKWDGYKRIDLSVPDAQVNIEVDGLQHGFDPKQALADLKRTYYSYKRGWLTLRIPNALVKNHLDETADFIAKFIKESIEELESDDDFN